MPWVAWPTLIGVLSCAGLAAVWWFCCRMAAAAKLFVHHRVAQHLSGHAGSGDGGVIALIAALSGYTMVKYFGVIFLGQPREEKLAQAHDAGMWERLGMLWLVTGCVLLGLFPNQMIALIDPVTRSWCMQRTGAHRGRQRLAAGASAHGARQLCACHLPAGCAGQLRPVVLAGAQGSTTGALRRVPPWDCGHPWQTARMQDTAEGFGQPIRQIFEPFFRMDQTSAHAFDAQPSLQGARSKTHCGTAVPAAGAGGGAHIGRLVGLLQQGALRCT
jgi:hydrogenase-4 component B